MYVDQIQKGRPLGTAVAVTLSTIIAIILTVLIIKYTRPALILIAGYSFAMTAGKFFTVAFSDSEQLATVIGIILAFHGIIHQIYLYGFLRSNIESDSANMTHTDPVTDMVFGIYESYFKLKSQLKIKFYNTHTVPGFSLSPSVMCNSSAIL